MTAFESALVAGMIVCSDSGERLSMYEEIFLTRFIYLRGLSAPYTG